LATPLNLAKTQVQGLQCPAFQGFQWYFTEAVVQQECLPQARQPQEACGQMPKAVAFGREPFQLLQRRERPVEEEAEADPWAGQL
jgi:hypothetical protein